MSRPPRTPARPSLALRTPPHGALCALASVAVVVAALTSFSAVARAESPPASPTSTTASTPSSPSTPSAPPAPVDQPSPTTGLTIASVVIEGHTLEDPYRLQRFLGLVPGADYVPATDCVALDPHTGEDKGDPVPCTIGQRAADALKALGYNLVYANATPVTPTSVALRLWLDPARVVRHIHVRGNWPVLRAIFNEDIIRRLTLRPGARLPPVEKLDAVLADESLRVKQYLQREGFYDADVDVVVVPGGRADWVDLDVLLHLGRWFTLGQIVTAGTSALTPKEVGDPFVHNFPPWYWSRFRQDQMHDDARSAESLYRRKGYPAARVFPEFDPRRDVDRPNAKVRLKLRVTEKGHVELHFIGNHALTDAQLTERVTIFAAGSYDETELAESAREIHRFYQTKGYFTAHVTFRHQRTGDVHDITFFVDEGPELRVRSVEFASEPGKPPLTADESDLRAQIQTRVFPPLGELGLGEGGYVTTLTLQQDVDKLTAWYQSRGYPLARVRGEVVRDPASFGSMGALAATVAGGVGKGEDLFVRFFVDEGRHEVIDSLELRYVREGKPAHDAAELAKAARLTVGDAIAPDSLTSALRRIYERYRATGHPYARLGVTLEWNQCGQFPPAPPLPTGPRPPVADLERVPATARCEGDHTRARIYLDVDEGDEVRFGEILIRGNFRTTEWTIRRDLPFRTGDLFDQSKLALAERNLQTHTVFNSVRVTTAPVDLPVGTNPVPILVEVQERYDDNGQLTLAVGYATDVGASISLGYFWGNVFGGGGQFELRGDVAADIFGQSWTLDFNQPFWRLLGGTVRYIHPHLYWPSLRGEVSGFARQETTPGLGEVRSFGARASVTWIPSLVWRVFGRVELSHASLQNIDFERLPGRGDTQTTVPDDTDTLKGTVGAVFDDRTSFEGTKNPLMPIAGTLLAAEASGSTSALFSTHSYLIFSGQAQRYQPLPKGLTLIVNLRGDWGVPLGETAIPAVERFFAGGDSTTRGYGTDQLRTEIVRGNVTPSSGPIGFRIIPQGGNVRFLSTVELQFPIASLGSFPWVGAVFCDAGTIFDDPRLFAVSRDVKVSVGVTLLRILTPVGPLSLEYAYPLTQSLAEESWKKDTWAHWPGRIHFNWGIPILR